MTAIRIRATDQLSGTTATQFRTTTTRILPVWTGNGWEEKPTRSPAWALLDIARDDLYGCGLTLADIDTQAIVDLAAINAAEGDCFDHEFRAATQATDALDTPLRVCRARHRWLGSTLSLVREHWRAVPSILTHGTAAGNIVELNAPAVEIGRPTYGKTDGITNMSIPLMFCPTAGDDDFTLAFK